MNPPTGHTLRRRVSSLPHRIDRLHGGVELNIRVVDMGFRLHSGARGRGVRLGQID